MTTGKKILGILFATWALIVFVITLLVIVIPICLTFLIKEPLGTEIFRQISKGWMIVWLNLVGCPLRIKGKAQFKKGETYIVTCNHNSFMDVPVTTPFIPGPNKTIAKRSISKVPLFGWIYTRGAVLVDRDSDESRRKSYEDMKKTLADGLHMTVYPEGTRNKTADPLKSFYDGAFKLALDTNKEIIPTLLFNTRTVMPQGHGFYFWPHRLEMHFLPAVDPAQFDTARDLKEHVFRIMWDYYSANVKSQN
ncbi:1-acyl-sn-glycerol-3-phosphate acyltransferase [Segetibacter sp. 3557_3]|uniref:lysophospholipid acyltransferase family protein n=1 Tax=Segetibacter sp. 3557_3 TaxID=2547429 RepID=UPI001058721F|nr:1-acyl-sn-glycerol-3-phosphate acyltransferase [Segetibacter sp. 3557_3]TDH26386.1 1-acyl-sn-glycerol-3-phosphate acyltransferase [Segetibacter sp. 3557_3]